MKRLFINNVDTDLLVKDLEDAVYGADTCHLFENCEIMDANDAHSDRVFVTIENEPYQDLSHYEKVTGVSK